MIENLPPRITLYSEALTVFDEHAQLFVMLNGPVSANSAVEATAEEAGLLEYGPKGIDTFSVAKPSAVLGASFAALYLASFTHGRRDRMDASMQDHSYLRLFMHLYDDRGAPYEHELDMPMPMRDDSPPHSYVVAVSREQVPFAVQSAQLDGLGWFTKRELGLAQQHHLTDAECTVVLNLFRQSFDQLNAVR